MSPRLGDTLRMPRQLVFLPPRKREPPLPFRPRPTPSLDTPMRLRTWLVALPWRFFLLAFAVAGLVGYALEWRAGNDTCSEQRGP